MTSLRKLTAVVAVSLPLVAMAQPAPEPAPAAPATPPTAAPVAPAPAPAPAPAAAPAPGPAAKVGAINFKFSGDFNHQAIVFTDQAGFYAVSETIGRGQTISKDTLEESFANFKYRLQVEGATSDNSVRGVYNIEIGGIRFGDGGNKLSGTDAIGTNGGAFSGDGDNYETRFAYVDFGVPGALKNRITIGLQPLLVNHYLWEETATGIQYKGDVGPAKLTVAWMRGRDIFTTRTPQEVTADGDNYLIRGDTTLAPDVKAGAFVLYQHQDPETVGTATGISYELKRFGADSAFDIFNVGVDAKLKFGDIFVNFDGIYQAGKIKFDTDLSAFFAHADVGINLGNLKLTYTGWYASGDDNTADKKVRNFIATDVDMFDSVVLFETFNDENYFTEAPYFLNFGGIFNKIAADYKVTPKVTVGAAAMYIMSAKEIPIGAGKKSDQLGAEFDAYLSYKPYPQLELAINAGYLISGDAMDRFEIGTIGLNGKADQDIFRSTARARYIF